MYRCMIGSDHTGIFNHFDLQQYPAIKFLKGEPTELLFCGFGDKYERICPRKLRDNLSLIQAGKYLYELRCEA